MPSLFVETPDACPASNQLLFPWDDEGSLQPELANGQAPAEPPIRTGSTSDTASDPYAPLTTVRDEAGVPRIAAPVRIGGVMIKLLKRYGITDEEIAAGVARYANKHAGRMAS